MSESGQRPEDPVDRVREVLETVGDALGLDAEVHVEQTEEGIRGVLEGDDLGLFIGRPGVSRRSSARPTRRRWTRSAGAGRSPSTR